MVRRLCVLEYFRGFEDFLAGPAYAHFRRSRFASLSISAVKRAIYASSRQRMARLNPLPKQLHGAEASTPGRAGAVPESRARERRLRPRRKKRNGFAHTSTPPAVAAAESILLTAKWKNSGRPRVDKAAARKMASSTAARGALGFGRRLKRAFQTT